MHGPRLFGILGRARDPLEGLPLTGGAPQLQPITHALKTLVSSDTRAYVGLYNPAVDVPAEEEPLPGLVGIQFLPDGDWLDAVAMFRRLDLSFWWAVNMVEIGRLLEWAAQQNAPKKTYKPRSVTFFASSARWKRDPEPAFVTELDSTDLMTLTSLVVQADLGKQDARQKLQTLLIDKAMRLNEVNVDDQGLKQIVSLAQGVVLAHGGNTQKKSFIKSAFGARLGEALNQVQKAVASPAQRKSAVAHARENIQAAAAELRM